MFPKYNSKYTDIGVYVNIGKFYFTSIGLLMVNETAHQMKSRLDLHWGNANPPHIDIHTFIWTQQQNKKKQKTNIYAFSTFEHLISNSINIKRWKFDICCCLSLSILINLLKKVHVSIHHILLVISLEAARVAQNSARKWTDLSEFLSVRLSSGIIMSRRSVVPVSRATIAAIRFRLLVRYQRPNCHYYCRRLTTGEAVDGDTHRPVMGSSV